jgi:hypothetical protein
MSELIEKFLLILVGLGITFSIINIIPSTLSIPSYFNTQEKSEISNDLNNFQQDLELIQNNLENNRTYSFQFKGNINILSINNTNFTSIFFRFSQPNSLKNQSFEIIHKKIEISEKIEVKIVTFYVNQYEIFKLNNSIFINFDSI